MYITRRPKGTEVANSPFLGVYCYAITFGNKQRIQLPTFVLGTKGIVGNVGLSALHLGGIAMARIRFICLFLALGLFAACNQAGQQQSQTQPNNQQPPASEQQAASPQAMQPSAPAEQSAAPAAAQPAARGTTQPATPAVAPQVPAASSGLNVAPAAQPAAAVAPAPSAPPRPQTAVISSGTDLAVRLQDALDSGVNKTGDSFEAILDEDIKVDGKVAVPRGSTITGRLVKVVRSGRVEGRAEMALTLKEIRVRDASYAITTTTISSTAESTKKQDALKIGGGAGIGAAIGAIAGGGKGAAIGAAVGGGAGTAAVVGTRGKEVKYASEQRLTFGLKGDLEVPLP
jgi:hypothetical protein